MIKVDDTPPNDATPEEKAFWNTRSELKHVFDFARARRAAPWATLLVVLTRIIASTGPTIRLPAIIGGQVSLNMFIAVVAKSGGGKDTAQAAARDAVLLTGDSFKEVTPGSGEGISHAYMRPSKLKDFPEPEQHTRNVLFSVAEIDTLLSLKTRNGSTLMPELRQAWMGQRLGFQYADAQKRLPVPAHEYRLCLIAGVQPLRASVLLDDSAGGTPQRFVWVSAVDKGAPDKRPPEPEPLKWIHPEVTSMVVELCQSARDEIDRAHLARARDEVDALDGHLLLCQEKVAMGLALFNGHTDITGEDWNLAKIVIAHSNETRASVQQQINELMHSENMSRGKAEGSRTIAASDVVEAATIQKVCKGILVQLEKRKDWVTSSDLRRAIRFQHRAYFEDALELLKTTGQVDIEDVRGTGQAGSRCRKRSR